MRSDGRAYDEIRPVKITPHYLKHPPGSCLIEMGNTKVICSAILEETVPPFLKGSGRGWLTAEYGMLPGSSGNRITRERMKIGGRTHEIQRLIGRSLRASIDLKALGERSLLIDCDVLDADGGTRTAAITGSYVAVVLALRKLSPTLPSLKQAARVAVAAISVGLVNSRVSLDLHYHEDKLAEVDMNVVKTSENRFVEIQGTAEMTTFDQGQLDTLLKLANKGIEELLLSQKKVLET